MLPVAFDRRHRLQTRRLSSSGCENERSRLEEERRRRAIIKQLAALEEGEGAEVRQGDAIDGTSVLFHEWRSGDGAGREG